MLSLLSDHNFFARLFGRAEHDSENYQTRSFCFTTKPKAEARKTKRGLGNSIYYARTE